MEFITDYKIEDYILNLHWEDLPDIIKERAKMCAIDLMGALILGSQGAQCQVGIKIAQSMGLYGEIPIIGHTKNKNNLLGASIIYGHSSNSFDIDDGNRQICGHPGTSFIGGVLSAGLEKDITYKEFLTTLVACYESTIRWAIAMQNHYGYLHSTGAYGAFGTAAGIGRIFKLTREQLNTALSIADYHAPMTPVMRAVEYPSMNKDGVPFGALVGCMAVLEAINGCTGKTHLLELNENSYLKDTLGEDYKILDLYFKPYTCCRWTHQPIRACIWLKNKYHFHHSEIHSVDVHTFTAAARLSKKKPLDTDEAQYNIAYPVACSLIYNDVGFSEIKTENVKDPEVVGMMDKLNFVVDPDIDKLFPDKRLAYVVITLKNGDKLKSEIFEAEGEPDDPALNLSWIKNKFIRITKPLISSTFQSTILDALITGREKKLKDIVNLITKALTGEKE